MLRQGQQACWVRISVITGLPGDATRIHVDLSGYRTVIASARKMPREGWFRATAQKHNCVWQP